MTDSSSGWFEGTVYSSGTGKGFYVCVLFLFFFAHLLGCLSPSARKAFGEVLRGCQAAQHLAGIASQRRMDWWFLGARFSSSGS